MSRFWHKADMSGSGLLPGKPTLGPPFHRPKIPAEIVSRRQCDGAIS